MRMYDLIVKKKNNEVLTKDEIEFMIMGYTRGDIPDYQMSSMMMAICFNGMNDEETLNLTMSMAHSGDMLDLSKIEGIKVDKHSTGGVGDKTSLALTPIVASCGVKIAKMSGRGLGHTGGTIDKLESFEGFSTGILEEEFINTVNRIGISIMGQTATLAPADKKLYALRDVTATVDNMSLIASSIMSKKLASGADAIILDVKTGSGAFMKKEEDSFELARKMVDIGKGAGRKMMAVVSDMDQPLGNMIGNALEVKEAIDTLNGRGPSDFTRLCYKLGSMMLMMGGACNSLEEGEKLVDESIKSGKALDKLCEFIDSQGGNSLMVKNPDLLPKAKIKEPLLSDCSGYVSRIVCDEVGICSLILGGGRETKESSIDLSVGIELVKKVGDFVNKGETLAYIYANDENKLKDAGVRLKKAYSFSDKEPSKKDVIIGVVE